MTRTPVAARTTPAAMAARADRLAAACLVRDDLEGFRRNLERSARFASLSSFDEAEYDEIRRELGLEA